MESNQTSKVQSPLDSLTNTIPELPRGMAIVILLCNIFFPSSGTFFMACIGDKVRTKQFICAGLQLVTIPLIVGFVWSIYWGVLSIQKSYK